MSEHSNSPKPVATKYSYSRKRWDGFSAWQEHLRKLAGTVGSAPATHRDRDLRRSVVPG
jgi:hypothetical protein